MEHFVLYRDIGYDCFSKIWHSSAENMLIYFYSDGGSIVCSESIYPIRKGALCFVGAGKYHYTMPDLPESYQRSKLMVSPDYLKALLSVLPAGLHTDASLVYSQLPPQAAARAEQLIEELHAREGCAEWDMIFASCCMTLLYLLNHYAVHSVAEPAGIIGQTLDYINNHIFEDFTIGDLCSAVHVSKPYLCRRFRQKTGVTIMDYILKTRIVLAENMLLESSIPVSEISARCGFSGASYFSRVFCRETGMTPLAYRRAHRS